MITPKTEYLTKQKNTFPNVDSFFNEKTKLYTSKCVVYGSYLNYSALQKECNDIANLFSENSSGTSYYNVTKISDDVYIVEETWNNNKYYIPYIPGKTKIKSVCSYWDFDSAVIAAIATKYMKTENCDKVADMVKVFEKLIDKPMEE